MSQKQMLLRLVEPAAADVAPLEIQCWSGGTWRPVIIDEEFVRAFRTAAAEGDQEIGIARESGSAAPQGVPPSEAVALEFEPDCRALLLLPGSWVWSGLEVIPRAARRQSSAVGYMVEEQLAEDVEDLHFACTPVSGDLCTVMAVSRYKMDVLHAQLERLGWPVTVAIPEYRLLSVLSGQSSVWLEGHWAHLWQGAGRGLTVHRSLLLPVAESLFAPETDDADAATGGERQSLRIFGQAEELEVAGLSQLADVEIAPAPAEELLLQQLAGTQAGNLLCGEYQISLHAAEGPWWKKPAIAVAACFIAQLLFFVGVGTYYKVQANRADADARALFSEIFPNDTPRADLRRQVQGYLNQSTGGAGDFASQLQQLASVWSGGDLRLQSLRFDGNRGELVLQLRAANLGQLDAVVGKLSNSQYRAELLAANELEDGVSGRIRLR
ncbi:type II secretion system protein GspL [Microbulbifer sp. SA54]|uniref:type II secretion system protein GspL n=1 Tax=Microbulbifer sp. SA54 TaxID=3401577 RepID=UPI003AAEC87B